MELLEAIKMGCLVGVLCLTATFRSIELTKCLIVALIVTVLTAAVTYRHFKISSK